jgi:hypothetical protein
MTDYGKLKPILPYTEKDAETEEDLGYGGMCI